MTSRSHRVAVMGLIAAFVAGPQCAYVERLMAQCHSLSGGGIETKGYITADGYRNIAIAFDNVDNDTKNRILAAVNSWNDMTSTTKIRFVTPNPWENVHLTFANGTGQVNSCGGYQPSTDKIFIHPTAMAASTTSEAPQVERVIKHEIAHYLGVDHQGTDNSRITWAPITPGCTTSILQSFSGLDPTPDDAQDAKTCVAQKTGTNQIPGEESGDFDPHEEECWDVYVVWTNYEWSSYHFAYVPSGNGRTLIESGWCGEPSSIRGINSHRQLA